MKEGLREIALLGDQFQIWNYVCSLSLSHWSIANWPWSRAFAFLLSRSVLHSRCDRENVVPHGNLFNYFISLYPRYKRLYSYQEKNKVDLWSKSNEITSERGRPILLPLKLESSVLLGIELVRVASSMIRPISKWSECTFYRRISQIPSPKNFKNDIAQVVYNYEFTFWTKLHLPIRL